MDPLPCARSRDVFFVSKIAKISMLTEFCFSHTIEPDLLEGDIIMTRSLERQIDDMEYYVKNNITGSKFDAIANRAWVNGRIPYVFSRGFSKFTSCSLI